MKGSGMLCRVELRQGLNKVGREMAEGKGAGREPELGVTLGRSGFELGQTGDGREKRTIGMAGRVGRRKGQSDVVRFGM